ncbi:MAG: hypothetical protein MZV70_52795 [Desulfobacterales bacterium]|nr:hypothetical protein [Desulfobacterales bacterium]
MRFRYMLALIARGRLARGPDRPRRSRPPGEARRRRRRLGDDAPRDARRAT